MRKETVSFANTVVNSSALTWLLKLMFFLNLSWISNYQVLQYSMILLWIAKRFVIVGWYFLKEVFNSSICKLYTVCFAFCLESCGMPQQISWRVSQKVRKIQYGLICKWPFWCLLKWTFMSVCFSIHGRQPVQVLSCRAWLVGLVIGKGTCTTYYC